MTPKLQIEPISSWISPLDGPIIISGPCSAETPEQVMETATRLAELHRPHMLRSGIWKPRTRPNTFEGNGEKALAWLVEAGKATGIPTATEVATTEHVEACLKAGIDVLWIGARTATNPFSVQAIADALKGVDIPVMVKNPINPDLQLWIGALERINRAGITKIAAIHRGFSTYHEEYRNAPLWDIPLKLKTFFPDLAIINDPSHISGSRTHLQEVAQKALDLDMDGLMIETHPEPENAWSDSAQQITPTRFAEMMDELHQRSSQSKSEEYNIKLEELRSQIDNIDHEMISLIAKRMDLTRLIGDYKKQNEVTIFQLDRWKEIMETRQPFGESKGLNAKFVEELLQLLHKESIKIQTRILND